VVTDAGEFEARVVVGADGGRSRVAREMGVVRPIPHLQKIALVSHYEVSRDPWEDTGRPFVEMHVDRSGAVCGFGPGAGGTANVTLVVPESDARAVAAAGPASYSEGLLARSFPQVARRLTGAARTRTATCGTFGHRTTRPIADGALLVGDAAAFVDPFTGEGVFFALRGAEIAAEAIHRALARGDASCRGLSGYARARAEEFARKYAVCAVVERAVHMPAIMRWAAPRLRREPNLLECILAVTGDMRSPDTLLSPAFLWAAATA
jgi:flavin-dependent dehydrogenase